MFAASKIIWALVNPLTATFLLLAVGIALLFTRRWRQGRALLVLILAGAVLTIVVPVGYWSEQALEQRFPQPVLPAHVDGIVMLGGELDPELSLASGQPVLANGAGRLLALTDLARRYPDAKLVFSGGSGRLLDQDLTEAEAMPLAMRVVGLDPARVIFEGRSRNTRENAVFTRDLVKPSPGQTWLLITSAFHMPRAVGCFRVAGFPVIPYPVDYHVPPRLDLLNKSIGFDTGYGSLSVVLKEMIGLAAYRAFGYTDALFPAP